MTPELLFFILRLALALALYAFLGAVGYLLWRDVRRASETAVARRRQWGRLVVLAYASPLPAGEGEAVSANSLSYPLLRVTSIGRAPTNNATVDDDTASLEHALLTLRGGQWWLEDLGSRNGTAVNGVRIDQPVVVTGGDVIGIGRVRLVIELD